MPWAHLVAKGEPLQPRPFIDRVTNTEVIITGRGLGRGTAAKVTAAALWQARTRLGPAPLRALFDLLRGGAAAPRTAGSWWRGLLVCAIDGTTLDVPDTIAK